MLNTSIEILGISGSLRDSSYNTARLRAAQELAPPHVQINIADLSALPMFNADLLAQKARRFGVRNIVKFTDLME